MGDPGRRRPQADVASMVEAAVGAPCWIAEGSLGPTVNAFVRAADVVVFLDYPRRVTLARLLRRWAGRRRVGMPAGHAERPNLRILRFAWSWHRTMRPELLADLDRLALGRVVTLRSPRGDVAAAVSR